MEQRKKEQDVLVVKDEQTGEIGVVAGLKRDGTPNMRAAKPEHEREFLRFDRHGDVLDNFFSNFFRQCKNPKRFSFYRVTAEGIENVLTVMKEMLKKPDEYKEVLDAHRVDTAKYEQQAEQMRQETPDAAEKRQEPDSESQSTETERQQAQPQPMRDTSLSTTAVSTAQRSLTAGASTSRRWSSRAIWNGCVTTASRALSTATLKSEVSALRCRHVCHCGRIPTVRYRSCRTRYAVRRITTNT